MANFNDLITSMGNTEAVASAPADTMNRLTEQLACTTMEDVGMDNNLDSDTSRNIDDVEMDYEAQTSDDYFEDDDDSLPPETSPTLNYDDKNTDTSATSSTPPPSMVPFNQVLVCYHQHIGRVTPQTLTRLNSMLQKPAGMRVLSLYNTWLGCSGWELHSFPIPDTNHDLEVLSLLMTVEIKNRWNDRHLRWMNGGKGNGVPGRWWKVDGVPQHFGILPPMSPEAHPYHPFWLPDPECVNDAGQ